MPRRNGGVKGAMEWWSNGVVEQWSGGVMEWWNGGMVEQWSVGVVDNLHDQYSNTPSLRCSVTPLVLRLCVFA
jgi:hypothetical protein